MLLKMLAARDGRMTTLRLFGAGSRLASDCLCLQGSVQRARPLLAARRLPISQGGLQEASAAGVAVFNGSCQTRWTNEAAKPRHKGADEHGHASGLRQLDGYSCWPNFQTAKGQRTRS